MGNNRSKVPDLEKLVKGGRKKFVRYEEGAMIYSMGVHTFQQLAKDARAVYHVKRIVLVNLDLDVYKRQVCWCINISKYTEIS